MAKKDSAKKDAKKKGPAAVLSSASKKAKDTVEGSAKKAKGKALDKAKGKALDKSKGKAAGSAAEQVGTRGPAASTAARATAAGAVATAPVGTGELAVSDTTVRPTGYHAEAVGRPDAVRRMTANPSLAAHFRTRDHDVLLSWARARGGEPRITPAKIGGGTILRIEFPATPGAPDWDAFLAAFDERRGDFVYQERGRDGSISTIHRIARSDKE